MAQATLPLTAVRQQPIQTQPLQVAEQVSIDAKTIQAAKRLFATLAALAFVPVIAFTAISLTVGAGYHMMVTVPISLFFLTIGIICLSMRSAFARQEASVIDYNNPSKLQQYRKEAAHMNFDQLIEKHGLKNLVKYQIATKDLQVKFDDYLRKTPLREVLQLDIPLLLQAGLIQEPLASKWQNLKDRIEKRAAELHVEESKIRDDLNNLRSPLTVFFPSRTEEDFTPTARLNLLNARQRCEADIQAILREQPSLMKVKQD